jgi:hypothetical protein
MEAAPGVRITVSRLGVEEVGVVADAVVSAVRAAPRRHYA